MSNEKSLIDDDRPPSSFKGVTFSGFKSTIVMQRLADSMNREKIEDACYWCAELICAGHYMELWETLIQFYCKYIHISNPKLSIYMASKLQRFRENMNSVENDQEQLEFRNESGFRSLFMEFIVILCTSPKKYTVQPVKVSHDDFNMLKLKCLLQAPDLSSCEKILKDEDPKELIIAINELSYNLTESVANTLRAYYWYEWIIEYSKLCKKEKQPCRIVKRDDIESVIIDDKYATNPVWLIWILLKDHAVKRGKMYERIVNSLFEIFCLRYTEVCNTKRRTVVYFAISILTTNIVFSEYEIVKDKRLLSCILSQSYTIFSQVKEHGRHILKEKARQEEYDVKEQIMQSGGMENNHVTMASQVSTDAMFGIFCESENKIVDTKNSNKSKKNTVNTDNKSSDKVSIDKELFGIDFIPRI